MLGLEADYSYTSDTGRRAVWERGWGYFRAFPLTGVGADNFTVAEMLGRDVQSGLRVGGAVAHNSYLEILSENGLPGFIFWFGMIGFGFIGVKKSQQRFRASKDPANLPLVQLGDAITLSMLAYCIGGFLLSRSIRPARLRRDRVRGIAGRAPWKSI